MTCERGHSSWQYDNLKHEYNNRTASAVNHAICRKPDQNRIQNKVISPWISPFWIFDLLLLNFEKPINSLQIVCTDLFSNSTISNIRINKNASKVKTNSRKLLFCLWIFNYGCVMSHSLHIAALHNLHFFNYTNLCNFLILHSILFRVAADCMF